jgi:branched-chain amino acid aminotransferase
MMTKSKAAGNYVNSMLAKSEAVRAGFDEAIMLDPQGYVAECTGENLFLVRKGKIYTSHTAAILEGITRDAIITLAKGLGYEVIEQPLVRDQLYVADEVFMCGTAAECVPVREIDRRQIGEGMAGPITRDIQKAFSEVIKGQHPLSDGWLDNIS